MDEPVGLVFAGRYQIMDLLAEDQFKHTYFAVDMSVDRNVTLVLIRPEMGANDSSRIAGEIRILGQVGVHENIVTLYDYGVADDVSYLVFQYMSGGTLDYYIQNMERSGQQLTIEDIRAQSMDWGPLKQKEKSRP